MKKMVLFGALLALPLAATAEGLSYNHVDVNWVADTELDFSGLGSVDGDGFSLDGVFSVSDMVYILGGYEDLTYDGNGGDLDLTNIRAGVGAHSNAYTGGVDIFGNLTYEDIELEVPGDSADDSGFGLEIGARMPLGTAADAYVSYQYQDIGDLEGNFFRLGGAYNFMPNWAAIAEYKTGEYEVDGLNIDLDRDDLRIGVRYNF